MEATAIRSRQSAKSEREYRLGDGPLSESLPRVARGRLEHASNLLRGAGDPGYAVHEARKDMKKIRSALRLVRESIGDEAYRRENEHYRDVSRGLARFRDAEAMLECLGELEGRAGQPGRFSGLRAHLLAEHRAGRRDGSIRAAAAEAVDRLEEGAGRIGEWELPSGEAAADEVLDAGLQRALRRGHRRLEVVEDDPADERWHDWRKRAKDLWYQRLLLGADPDLTERAHELSSLLGDDHDLSVLREVVETNAGAFSWDGEVGRITDLIVRRRDQLQGEALALGRPLYEPVSLP